MDILCSVTNQKLKISNYVDTVEGTKGYMYCHFTFLTEDWNGLMKTAFFRNPETGETYKKILENDVCEVPWEALANKGYVHFSVVGEKENVRIPTNTVSFKNKEGITEGIDPGEPTPSQYEQIIQIMMQNKEISDSIRQDADNGVFDGNGIEKIEKVSSEGNVDTYRIFFSDGKTFDYTVTNASQIPYIIGDGLKLDEETNTLSVDVAEEVQQDNTKPITSAAVFTTVGNIEILLGTI